MIPCSRNPPPHRVVPSCFYSHNWELSSVYKTMRCNWINSTEGQPFCWVPSCPLPIPASCSHHRNCSSSHPGLQALGERVTGTSCGLRDPGCWWSGPLLPFVWQPLEQIKLGRVAGVCTWIALFKTCVEGRITFVLGHKQAGILLSLLLQRELLIWFFFFLILKI